jgi:hypothetical protein
MKKLMIVPGFLLLMAAALLSSVQISSIYGVIDPAGAAKRVLAISTARDTVVVVPQDGRFSVAVNGGVWKLYIEAVPPFKDAYAENIKVTDGRSTDAGILRLTK